MKYFQREKTTEVKRKMKTEKGRVLGEIFNLGFGGFGKYLERRELELSVQ